MECKDAKNLLSNYLENDLGNLEKAQVELHLRACKTCQAELESLKRMVAELGSLNKVSAPKDLLEGVHRRLGLEPPKKQFPQKIKVPLEAVGVLASIILIVYFANQSGFFAVPPMLEQVDVTKARAKAVPQSMQNVYDYKTVDFDKSLEAPETGAYKAEVYRAEAPQMQKIDAYEVKGTQMQEKVTLSKAAMPAATVIGQDISKIKEIIKKLGGEVEKEDAKNIYIKVPSANLSALLEQLKNFPDVKPGAATQEADTSYLAIEVPEAQR